MAEQHSLNFLLPLKPPPSQLAAEAEAMMDGYEPMSGRVGIEITYLVLDCKTDCAMPSEIINALQGTVFHGEPDDIRTHVLADGYSEGAMVIRVWQEEIK